MITSKTLSAPETITPQQARALAKRCDDYMDSAAAAALRSLANQVENLRGIGASTPALDSHQYRHYHGIEYRKGRFSLFLTYHDDGHAYVEIHRCSPQDYQQPCTEAEVLAAIQAFLSLPTETSNEPR